MTLIFLKRVGRRGHADNMYPYHMYRARYLETGNVLLDCKFAADSMAIAGCIVTVYLLNTCNLTTTVSIIHTILMCGQVGILKPQWQVSSNKFQYQYVVCSCIWSVNWSLNLRRTSSGETSLRFLWRELPQFLENMPLNEWGIVYFQKWHSPSSICIWNYKFS